MALVKAGKNDDSVYGVVMKLQALTLVWLGMAVMASNDKTWPQYMGPHRDGTTRTDNFFKGPLRLERLWIQALGSGYSSITVGANRLYVMHAAGEMDALTCYEASSGRLIWTYPYGPAFAKVGASEPGPLSMPVLDGDRIMAVGAGGEFFCLDTSSGKRIWQHQLVADYGAKPVDTGMTTSPMVYGDLVLLNLGDQKDKAIAAFNKNSGDLVWHLGSEKISFQSPTMMKLNGRDQIVTLSEGKLRGLNPKSGAIIWEQDGQEWIFAIQAGGDGMLLSHFRGIAYHRLQKSAAGLSLKEVWSSYDVNLEYDMPIVYQDHVYGFRTGIMSCLDLKTGKERWSSWQTGGGMAIMANDHLGILCDDGMFRVVHARPEGYLERASIKVFEKSGITEPSFADGVFYMRTFSQIAAVKVVSMSRAE